MCELFSALGLAGAGGGAAAAGATAAAAGSGLSFLQVVGLAAGIGGQAINMQLQDQAFEEQQAILEQQRETERRIGAIEEQRTLAEFEGAIDEQAAQLLNRGIDPSSPTAILLGVSAAREASFAAQSVRSNTQATDIELNSQQRILRSRQRLQRFRGQIGVANTILTAAPDIWPELLA